MDDAHLVGAALAGDKDAFAAIYDRYADRIHDFAWGVLRHREDAADVTQETFLVASARLAQLRDPSKLRPWLFAIARNECTRRGRARARVRPSDEMADVPATGAGADEVVESAELGRLLWEAAAGLSERDRTILELHLRHGLEGDDLGRALGVTTQHGYVLVSRLREQIERSVGALVVARAGRRDCPDLAEILRGWDGRMSPVLRKRVARHVDGCDICGQRRAALVHPGGLLAALPLVPAPSWVREHVLEDVDLVAHSRSSGERWDEDGFPPAEDEPVERRRAPRMRSVAGVVVVLALLGGTVLATRRAPLPLAEGVSETSPTTRGQAGPTTTPGVPTTAPPTTLPLPSPLLTTPTASPTTLREQVPAGPPGTPADLVPDRDVVDFGVDGTKVDVRLANRGGAAVQWSLFSDGDVWLRTSPVGDRLAPGEVAVITFTLDRAVAPEGDLLRPVTLRWAGGAAGITVAARMERVPAIGAVDVAEPALVAAGCKPDRTTVNAAVTDETALKVVELRWQSSAGTGSTPMATGGDGWWSATLGPFPAEGKVTFSVAATDTRGNGTTTPAESLFVSGCGPP